MNVRRELHTLVDGLEAQAAKQQLHTVIDDMDEEQARDALMRMRQLGVRGLLEQLGFSL